MLDRWLLEIKQALWAEGQRQTGDGTIGISLRNPLGPGGRAWGASAAYLSSVAKRAYLPANDSAALAAKAFDFFGMDSITFISCQS